jgi:hypothetical protein
MIPMQNEMAISRMQKEQAMLCQFKIYVLLCTFIFYLQSYFIDSELFRLIYGEF